MLTKKVPLYLSILMMLAAAMLSSFIFPGFHKNNKDLSETVSSNINSNNNYCNYKIVRLNGYKYTHPLMYVDPSCESQSLTYVKNEITDIIESYKIAGTLSAASVYLRVYGTGDWISIADQDKFSPGSLLKIPELITYFKMNENKPGLLDKQISFDKPFSSPQKNPVFLSKSIELGKKYTIRELLYYMIAYSDNEATILLNNNIDTAQFKKTFTDLGLQAPDWHANNYPITARDFSLFMKILYNASYLTIEDSEYCTELLSHSDFKQGMLAGLPADIKIAHKFGEAGSQDKPELSESAIIYNNNKAYVITIMTRGTDMKKLPQVISKISALVYEKLQQKLIAAI